MFGLIPYGSKNGGVSGPRNLFDVESIFENFFNDSFLPSFYNSRQMKVDVKENDTEYIVEAELPGVKKEEIEVDFTDGRLTISAEKKEEITDERTNYVRRERRVGSIARSFIIDNVDNEKISARFENGVLSIKLPKKEPEVQKRGKIDIL